MKNRRREKKKKEKGGTGWENNFLGSIKISSCDF